MKVKQTWKRRGATGRVEKSPRMDENNIREMVKERNKKETETILDAHMLQGQ